MSMGTGLYQRPNGTPCCVVPSYDKPSLTASIEPVQPTIAVSGSLECHVTPESVAARLVSYRSAEHKTYLEPQTGTANIVFALLESGVDIESITMVEFSYDLAEFSKNRLREAGYPAFIHRSCFLDFAHENADKRFDCIPCNPPFSKAKKHIQASADLLSDSPDAEIIALLPCNFKAVPAGFQSERLEELDEYTFASTKVRTTIFRFTRL